MRGTRGKDTADKETATYTHLPRLSIHAALPLPCAFYGCLRRCPSLSSCGTLSLLSLKQSTPPPAAPAPAPRRQPAQTRRRLTPAASGRTGPTPDLPPSPPARRAFSPGASLGASLGASKSAPRPSREIVRRAGARSRARDRRASKRRPASTPASAIFSSTTPLLSSTSSYFVARAIACSTASYSRVRIDVFRVVVGTGGRPRGQEHIKVREIPPTATGPDAP